MSMTTANKLKKTFLRCYEAKTTAFSAAKGQGTCFRYDKA